MVKCGIGEFVEIYVLKMELSTVIEAFVDETMLYWRVYEWYNRFQEGPENVEADARSGRPSSSIIKEKVNNILERLYLII